jgi:pimeloyl-ACP methyl ester carboxylesterase
MSTAARKGLLGSAIGFAAAAAGAVLVADRKVAVRRREGMATLDGYTAEVAARAGFLRSPDGVSLYYEEDGPLDAPLTVVLVHGFCLNRDGFLFQRRALLDTFGDEVRVISYDQRSHGRSGRSDQEHATIDCVGADLYQVLVARVPDGPIMLVGHSMGGMTIMALADAHPELFGADGRIAGVVLMSTTTGKLGTVTLGFPAALARIGGPALPVLLRGARREVALVERGRAHVTDIAWVFVRRFAFGGAVDPGLVEFLARIIAETPVDVIADFYPTLIKHDKLAAIGVLTKTRVCVVCGERDLLTPPEHAMELVEQLPDAELLIVPGAGHQVPLERPDLVERPLIRMVREILAAR